VDDPHRIFDRVRELTRTPEHSRTYFDQHRGRFERTLREIAGVRRLIRSAASGPVKVLDIGAHELHIALACRALGFEVTGVDVAEFTTATHIKRLASEHNIELFTCDLSLEKKLPVPDDAFDLVLFFETLEHLNFHPLNLMRELARVVKPGGLLAVTTPNQLSIGMLVRFIRRRSSFQDIRTPYSIATHYRLYTRDEVESLMDAAGLKVVKAVFVEFPVHHLNRSERCFRWVLTKLVPPWSNNMFVVGRK